MIIEQILSGGITSSNLMKVPLTKSSSEIIKANGNIVFCAVYKNLKGLFRKDVKETKEFGRKMCDLVKNRLGNNGFFTSDELPGYGISAEELKQMAELTGAGKNDLIVILAYQEADARKTKNLLDELLKQATMS